MLWVPLKIWLLICLSKYGLRYLSSDSYARGNYSSKCRCMCILKVAWMYKHFHFIVHQHYTRPIPGCYWILEKDTPENNTIYILKVVRNQHSGYNILAVVVVIIITIFIVINVSAALGNLDLICNPIEFSSLFHHYNDEINNHNFLYFPLEVSSFFLTLSGKQFLAVLFFSSFLDNA